MLFIFALSSAWATCIGNSFAAENAGTRSQCSAEWHVIQAI
jgi:hypothetical protein